MKGVRVDLAGFDLARALAASGDRAGAIDALSRVTPANERDAASWMTLGDMAVQLDAPPLEVRFFGRAADSDPSNATAHLNLAVALAQAGQPDRAREHARRALELQPGYVKARQLLDALK